MNDSLLSPLLTAAENGKTHLVKCLLHEGHDINTRNVFGMNCIHIAANRGHYNLVEFLCGFPGLISSICMERQDDGIMPSGIYDGYTALHFNAYNGNMKVGKLLLRQGAKVNVKEQISGRTPLLIAVKNNKVELAELLLSYGADIQARDKHKNTALHMATESRCLEKLEILDVIVKAGVYVHSTNKRGNTALHIACKNNNVKVVMFLLAYNCGVNVKNLSGKTPLFITVEESGHKEIIKALLENGADPNTASISGDTALHIASKKNNIYHVNQLLLHDCDTNIPNNDHFTPLHFAAKFNHREVVEILLIAGVDVDYKNKHGETALTFALESGSIEISRMLLSYGSNVHIRNRNNCTLLHHAVTRGSMNIIQLILKCGIDYDAVDGCDRTALDFALESRHSSIAKFLLDYGCNINIMKSEFLFPTQYFIYCKEITEVFLKHIIKMTTIERYISEEKLALLNTNPLKNSFKIDEFRDECLKEVVALKKAKITNTSISLYKLLKTNVNQLVKCLNNEDVVNASYENYKLRYPIYGNMIRLQFEKGFLRKTAVHRSKKYFDRAVCNLPLLPKYCIEAILSQLSSQDLLALKDAFNE